MSSGLVELNVVSYTCMGLRWTTQGDAAHNTLLLLIPKSFTETLLVQNKRAYLFVSKQKLCAPCSAVMVDEIVPL